MVSELFEGGCGMVSERDRVVVISRIWKVQGESCQAISLGLALVLASYECLTDIDSDAYSSSDSIRSAPV